MSRVEEEDPGVTCGDYKTKDTGHKAPDDRQDGTHGSAFSQLGTRSQRYIVPPVLRYVPQLAINNNIYTHTQLSNKQEDR